MKFYFPNVPRLGNVVLTRHAQERAVLDGVTEAMIEKALMSPAAPDKPDGQDIVWREGVGFRLVILLKPTPDRGAKVVKTLYRIQAQAKATQ